MAGMIPIGVVSAVDAVVVFGNNLFNASKYPEQVGLYNGLLAHGSTEYFKLKLTLYISGPYGPCQKLLSLPMNPYCT
jgi:hypothetical protein